MENSRRLICKFVLGHSTTAFIQIDINGKYEKAQRIRAREGPKKENRKIAGGFIGKRTCGK